MVEHKLVLDVSVLGAPGTKYADEYRSIGRFDYVQLTYWHLKTNLNDGAELMYSDISSNCWYFVDEIIAKQFNLPVGPWSDILIVPFLKHEKEK